MRNTVVILAEESLYVYGCWDLSRNPQYAMIALITTVPKGEPAYCSESSLKPFSTSARL
jgi:hypothetical protein